MPKSKLPEETNWEVPSGRLPPPDFAEVEVANHRFFSENHGSPNLISCNAKPWRQAQDPDLLRQHLEVEAEVMARLGIPG